MGMGIGMPPPRQPCDDYSEQFVRAARSRLSDVRSGVRMLVIIIYEINGPFSALWGASLKTTDIKSYYGGSAVTCV